MPKAFQLYWRSDSGGASRLLLDSDDPTEAETGYFQYCKWRTEEPGCLFLQSTAQDQVPSGRFITTNSRSLVWNIQREMCQTRKNIVWAMPEEVYYDGVKSRWSAPTAAMVKGLKLNIFVENRGISGEQLARKLGRSARGIRYWICTGGESRSIDFSSWRLMQQLAGYQVKGIRNHGIEAVTDSVGGHEYGRSPESVIAIPDRQQQNLF